MLLSIAELPWLTKTMALKLARTLITKSAAIPSIFMIRYSVAANPWSRIATHFRMCCTFSVKHSPFCDPNTDPNTFNRILNGSPRKEGWVWKQAWEDACKKFEFEGDESTISMKYWRVYINTTFLKGMSRDEIIDTYLNTLASMLGSKEEARQKMYSVYAQDFYFFVCNVSEEVANKFGELPSVLAAEPLSNGDLKKPINTGEPFINGQVVPYDPNFFDEMLWDFYSHWASCAKGPGPRAKPPGYDKIQAQWEEWRMQKSMELLKQLEEEMKHPAPNKKANKKAGSRNG